MRRLEMEITHSRRIRWLMEMQPTVIWIRMSIPATVPPRVVGVGFDVVNYPTLLRSGEMAPLAR